MTRPGSALDLDDARVPPRTTPDAATWLRPRIRPTPNTGSTQASFNRRPNLSAATPPTKSRRPRSHPGVRGQHEFKEEDDESVGGFEKRGRSIVRKWGFFRGTVFVSFVRTPLFPSISNVACRPIHRTTKRQNGPGKYSWASPLRLEAAWLE